MKDLLQQFPTFDSFDGTEKPQKYKLVGKKRPGFPQGGQSVPRPSPMLDTVSPKPAKQEREAGTGRGDRKPPTQGQKGKPKPFAKNRPRQRHYNEPGEVEFVFGSKVQPSSAPNDSPMRKW